MDRNSRTTGAVVEAVTDEHALPGPGPVLDALDASHERLRAVVDALPESAWTGPSYCSEWSVAQVLSHLGSGAEITLARVEAALAGEEPPAPEHNRAVWARWDALRPEEMVVEGLRADGTLLERLRAVPTDELARATTVFYGEPASVTTLLAFRLDEHVLHVFDLETVLDPTAELLPSAVPILLDLLPTLARFLARRGEVDGAGRSAARHLLLEVRTSAPARRLLLGLGDGASLRRLDEGEEVPSNGRLSLPAAALVRLLTGRLDPAHTPAGVVCEGDASLDDLREVFAGF